MRPQWWFQGPRFLLLQAEQCSNYWETVHTVSFVCFSLSVWGGWQRQSALWAENYSLQTDLTILKSEYISQPPRGIWKRDQCPSRSSQWLNQNLWGMGTSIAKLPRWVWWMASRENHRPKQTSENLPLEPRWEGKGESTESQYVGNRVSLSLL